MKIKNGFVKREVAGSHVVVSVDPANGFNGMIKLNETSNFLWDKLTLGATREELVEIIHRLEDDLHYFDFLEGEWGGCAWEWNDFRRFQKWNLKNLKKLAGMMKRHPEIEVIFYDSY
jgi:hypothetical protein